MANQVLLKKSSVASRVPTTSDLAYGEVALNYTDGKLYYKDSSNNINYFLESSQTEATLDDVVTNGSTTTTTAVIPFYYASQSNFPNATTYHGAIAHSHFDGAMYFAHGGSWNKLANDSQLASYQTISGLNGAIDSHLNQSNPTAGYVLSWNGTDYAWSSVSALGGGIQYTDLSVTTAPAGTASLSYNNTNGVFTYTPPNLTSYLTDITGENLGDLSNVTLTSPTNGQVLKYDSATSAWINSTDAGGIALTDLSVTTNAAGTAALSYNNTTGVFSYTPPDLSSYLQSSDIGSTVLAYDSNLQSFVTAFTLPTVDGSANQVLSTDGNGTLSFVNQSTGGSSASDFDVTSDTFTGNNSTTAYTLTQVAAADQYVIASLNGVVQDPADYSVSGTTLTFTTAPGLNDNVELRTFSRHNANVSLRDYQRFIYTITSTVSSISGNDDNAVSLVYDVGFVDVYQNGIRLVNGDDYTATNGTSISLTDSALNGDTIEVISHARAYVNDPQYQFTTNTVSFATTAQGAVDTFVASTYDSAKYIVQAKITGEIHATEILVMHDGTDVFVTEYGTMWSGSASLGTFTADLNSGNIRLLFTPANINTTVKFKRIVL